MNKFWMIAIVVVVLYAIYKHKKQSKNVAAKPVSVVSKVSSITTGSTVGIDPIGIATFDPTPAPSGHGDAVLNANVIPPAGSTVKSTDYAPAFGAEENQTCSHQIEYMGAYQLEALNTDMIAAGGSGPDGGGIGLTSCDCSGIMRKEQNVF